MKERILNIETVHQCNCCLGCKTLHPLVSVIDLSKSNLEQQIIKFDFYTILMMEGEIDDVLYGRKYYDYSNASLVFLTPGESIKINKSKALPSKGWLLAFHPEEALHLSQREKAKAAECICNIEEELRHAIDCHSQILISRYIELLLDHCNRFYERQFITRCEANKKIMKKTDVLLKDYILSGKLKYNTSPSLGYCAKILQLSSHYFNDLLKFESGKNIDEYFESKRLEMAKSMLLDSNNTVSVVTEKLGYPNIRYFSRLFKRITGVAPNNYRLSQN